MDRITEYYPGWERVGTLGAGSFGEVYKIRKLTDNDDAGYFSALKVIHVPHNRDEIRQYENEGYSRESISRLYSDRIDEIKSEIRIMARLKGESNIVSYEDHCVVPDESGIGGDVLIRMELLTPLTKSFSGSFMSEAEVIKLGIDICKALELCEKNNIIHRDIKPQNIFLSKNGNYKLGDFGIAKTCDGTDFGTLSGSFSYIAPEIVMHQKYNSSVDIYSLGMVMYWALNGRRGPFVTTQSDIPTSTEQNAAFNLRMSGKSIPRAAAGSKKLNRIIKKAAAFRPSDRYRSPSAMRRDLEALSGTALFTMRGQGTETMTLTPDSYEDTVPGNADMTVRGSGIRRMLVGTPRFPAIAAAVAAAAVLIAAGIIFLPELRGSAAEPTAQVSEAPSPGIDAVALELSELELGVNSSRRLGILLPAGAKESEVLWSSSAPDVASVDETGLVTALSPGTVKVTAVYGASAAVCTVTVAPENNNEEAPLSISLDKKTLRLTAGGSGTLTARISSADKSTGELRWTSSDSRVASVANGRVTARSEGTAVITAYIGSVEASCTVTVVGNEAKPSQEPSDTPVLTVRPSCEVTPTKAPQKPSVSSVTLNKSSLSLTVGESAVLSASVKPSDAADTTVIWKSSNSSVAAVSGGTVTAMGSGTASITASAGGKTASCTVTVTKAKGKAPSGYSISIDGGLVIKDVDFTLHVYPNEPDFTDIRIYAIAPTGETFSFDLGRSTGKGLNCYIAGRWKVYAVITNEYGSYSGAEHGVYYSFDVISVI